VVAGFSSFGFTQTAPNQGNVVRRIEILISALVALLASAAPAAVEDDPALIAARGRQQAVKSAVIEYKIKDVISKGGWVFTSQARPVPPDDITFESNNRLIFDGARYRIDNNHFVMLFGIGTNRVIQVPLWTASDGTVTKSLWREGMPNSGPWGTINGVDDKMDLKIPDLDPVWMCLRWDDSSFVPQVVGTYKPSGSSKEIDGAKCREYAAKQNGRTTVKLWVDPNKDYTVRRLVCERDGRISDQWDVSYRRHEKGIWVPEAWSHRWHSSDGRIVRVCRAEAMAVRLNEPLPAESFDLTFPVGSILYDQRDQRDPRNPAKFHVEADGSIRRFTEEEIRPPVQAKNHRWYRRNQWVLGSAWVAVGVGLLVYVVRRLRAARSRRRLGMQS